MKKTLSLFLVFCLLLPGIALADVQSQVNAPAHISDTFQSNTGKTVIDVDADITVPSADALYLIPVTSTVFDDSMVLLLADLVWPGLGSRKLEIIDENDTESMEGRRQVNKYFHHSAGVIQMGTRQRDIDAQVNTSYYQYPSFDEPLGAVLSGIVDYDNRFRQKKTVNYSSPYPAAEITEDIAEHPLSLAQAVAIGDQLMNALTDQPFALFSVGKSRGYIPNDKLMREGRQYDGTGFSYTLAYTRVINGAALLPCYGALMNTSSFRDDLFVPAVGYEQVLLAINREGQITCFIWSSPYLISDERTEQSLLPFENILSVARQTLPLKYQVNEVRGDIHLLVYRIDLGYMAVLQRDTLTFALTPVWTFYGNDLPEDIHVGCRPLLTVNAVDGTVIDLEYGY
ncbi:MAG: hypothetical protein IJ189_01920 [Clostridia bacterium]|nr:hypothetical protein [Clostridia bacterium]